MRAEGLADGCWYPSWYPSSVLECHDVPDRLHNQAASDEHDAGRTAAQVASRDSRDELEQRPRLLALLALLVGPPRVRHLSQRPRRRAHVPGDRADAEELDRRPGAALIELDQELTTMLRGA